MAIDLGVWLCTVVPLALLHWCWWRCRPLLRLQLLLDLCLLVVTGPALLGGHDLSPVRCLQRTPPMTAWQWAPATELQPTQSDLTLQLHPWWAEARRQLLDGTIPWMSDRLGGGLPLAANGQCGLLAPVMAPVWLLGPERGTTVMAFWRLQLAGLGTFLLLWRGWRLAWCGAAVGALAYGCGCYQVAWLLSPLATATAALPWVWWGVSACLRRRNRWPATILLGILLGWLLGSGINPETAAIVIGSGWLAGLIMRPRRWLRVASLAGLVVVVALVLAWPTVGYIAGSGKGRLLRQLQPNRQPLPLSVRLSATRQLLVPAVNGHPGRGDWQGPFPHAPAATGIGGAALALVAAARGRRRYRRLQLAALACMAIALVLAYRVPPLDWLLVRLPPIDVMTLPRFAVLLPWGLAILAGLAADGIVAGRWRQPLLRGLPVVVLGGVVLWAAPWNLTAPSLAMVAVSVLLAAIPVVLPRLPGPAIAGRLVVGAVTLELALLAWGINPTADRRDRLPDPPAMRRLQALVATEHGRIIGLGRALPPNLASRYGLADLRAFDPLRPQPFTRLMAALGETEPVLGGPLMAAPARLCGAWSVRYLVTPPDVKAPGWQELWHDHSAILWRNPSWLPEIRLVGQSTSVAQPWDRLTSLDLGTTALVPPGTPACDADTLNLEQLQHSPVQVRATVTCNGSCMLVVARPIAPGWQATIDNQPVDLVVTNLAAIGVPVPAGRHQVLLRYRPWHWWPIPY